MVRYTMIFWKVICCSLFSSSIIEPCCLNASSIYNCSEALWLLYPTATEPCWAGGQDFKVRGESEEGQYGTDTGPNQQSATPPVVTARFGGSDVGPPPPHQMDYTAHLDASRASNRLVLRESGGAWGSVVVQSRTVSIHFPPFTKCIFVSWWCVMVGMEEAKDDSLLTKFPGTRVAQMIK